MVCTYTRACTHTQILGLYKIIRVCKFYCVFLDSVCNNNYFCKPTKAEFQNIAREALRSAKQRHRTSTRILRNREQQARGARHFWDDSHVENELQPDVMEPNNIIETNIMEFNVTENED